MAARSGTSLAGHRSARLSHSLSGTNSVRTGDYNQRTVLNAIRRAGETTRTKLAAQTGLSTPTVVGIVTRLVELGLVVPLDKIRGRRGQPAKRMGVAADGAYGVGLNIDRDHLTLVVVDLAGDVRWRRTVETAFALPDAVVTFAGEAVAAALAETAIDPARILGIGVAVPNDLGRIVLPYQPADYDGWDYADLPAMFAAFGWPVYVDNDAAAAAMGEAQSEVAFEEASFFYLLVSAGLGGGLVIDRTFYRGATGRSGEIGLMPDDGSGGPTVQDVVSISALLDRLEAAGLPRDVDDALADAMSVIDLWIDDAVRTLTAPLIAVTCLMNPAAVVIGGRLPQQLIERLASGLRDTIDRADLPFSPIVRPAAMADHAPALGAAIIPFLDRLLPSDSILIKPDDARQSTSESAPIGAPSLRATRATSSSEGGVGSSSPGRSASSGIPGAVLPIGSSMARSFAPSVIFSRAGIDASSSDRTVTTSEVADRRRGT
ncbi:ROK family transcriptional regulator [Sphingomonas sp. Tas61C01]|uniref:ROK family transcriptional regulator n=1 Tax=Sphingomonas sp. Tas61C01 TaxID=3458297 RepID=UPI00403E5735